MGSTAANARGMPTTQVSTRIRKYDIRRLCKQFPSYSSIQHDHDMYQSAQRHESINFAPFVTLPNLSVNKTETEVEKPRQVTEKIQSSGQEFHAKALSLEYCIQTSERKKKVQERERQKEAKSSQRQSNEKETPAFGSAVPPTSSHSGILHGDQ